MVHAGGQVPGAGVGRATGGGSRAGGCRVNQPEPLVGTGWRWPDGRDALERSVFLRLEAQPRSSRDPHSRQAGTPPRCAWPRGRAPGNGPRRRRRTRDPGARRRAGSSAGSSSIERRALDRTRAPFRTKCPPWGDTESRYRNRSIANHWTSSLNVRPELRARLSSRRWTESAMFVTLRRVIEAPLDRGASRVRPGRSARTSSVRP